MRMSDYPERISISPTSRQKREDDFFLIDGKAFPGKGTEYVRADRIEELEAKLAEYKMVASTIDNQWADGEDENADLKAKLAKAVEALTPSVATKTAYMGEFSFPQTITDENGEEATVRTDVPWSIIKEIMAAILARATLKELTGDSDE